MTAEENNEKLARLYRELDATPLRDPALIDSFMAFLERQSSAQSILTSQGAFKSLSHDQMDGLLFSRQMLAELNKQLGESRHAVEEAGITHEQLERMGRAFISRQKMTPARTGYSNNALEQGGDLHNLLMLHVAIQEGRAGEYVHLMAAQQAFSMQNEAAIGIPTLLLSARQRSENTPIDTYYSEAHGVETKVTHTLEQIFDQQLRYMIAPHMRIDPETRDADESRALGEQVTGAKSELLKQAAQTFGFKYNPTVSATATEGFVEPTNSAAIAEAIANGQNLRILG